MKKTFVLSFLFCAYAVCSLAVQPVGQEVEQILFHDSPDPVFYDCSWINQSAPSSVDLAEGKTDKLPVSTHLYKKGNNALRLTWQSQTNGSWMALVAGVDWPMYRMEDANRLTFWLYAPEAINLPDLPKINMEGHYGGQTAQLPLSQYIHDLPVAEWVEVTIPIQDFRDVSPTFEAFNAIKGVFFHQAATDGKPHTLYIDEVSFWGTPVGHEPEMLPYLQAPTAHSVVINWHSFDKDILPQVRYGLSPDHLDQTITGTNEQIVDRIWNTVRLSNLTPDTEYFYQCVSGEFESKVHAFRTYREKKGGKVRLVLASDSQDDEVVTSDLVNRFTAILKEKYGEDLHNHIHLICHMGDAVSGGGVIEQYENRYYRPFSPLTHAIPAAMVTGNHDVEDRIYYQYAKYDDFANGVEGVNQEAFYTLHVNGVQMYMLNSNEGVRIPEQLDWLERELKKTQSNDDVVFALGCCHHVFYSEFWPDGSGADLNEDSYQGTPYVRHILKRLQACEKVPALINGHVHAYEHHVLPGQCEGERDFLEITVGGAGGHLDRWHGGSVGPDLYEGKVALDHYHFVLLELDVDNKTFEGTMYSFGNPDRPLDGVVADTFYGKVSQPAPAQPTIEAYSPNYITLSDYQGADSLMTVHIQIADNADFQTPLLDKKLDAVNIYGVDENFIPVNKNEHIDLKHIDLTDANLEENRPYFIRVRYRDNNLKWSEWSAVYPTISTRVENTTSTITRVWKEGETLYVSLPEEAQIDTTLTLYSLSAQPLCETKSSAASPTALPIGNLAQGLYILYCHGEHIARAYPVLL